MRIKQNQLFLALLTVFVAAGTVLAQQTIYPATKRVDHFDEYFGEKVHDPYRWLEGDAHESEEVAAWVEAQNKVTFDYLKNIPQRQAIHKRLTELWNYEKISAPFIAGNRYYLTKNDGLQNHSVVYMMDSLSAEPRVLFDPNTWSSDGTVALGGMAFSDDGKHVAFGKSEGGSDWRTWKVRNIQTGEDLADELKWVKFSSPAWTIDGKGFFYSRYAAPEKGSAFVSVNEFQKLYYHRIGTEQAKDVLVYENQDEPKWGFGPNVTEDGRYLIVTIWKGTGDKYRVMYKDLHEPFSMLRDLISEFENEYTFLSNDGPVFFFRTDLNAPKRRVIAIDIRTPQKEYWQEIISESDDTLNSVSLVGDMFIVSYLQDAKSAVRVFDMQGEYLRDVHLPGIGSSYGFSGKRKHIETFYGFSSFAIPPSTYRYDIRTGKSTLLNRAKVDMNPDDFVTIQKFYTSKDGTRVPMFITHKKGIKLDGTNPTLLYAYGGFNISITPRFSITRLAWMDMGGIYAVANIRGGGEYGEQWHQAGTKLNKQNVFDDFIAAAEWLIDNKYTNPSKLAIQGGSNGGLLVGACMTQRPDLYGACLPAVGVMDMLRFHKFTIGWAWVDDYGSSDDPEQFKALRAYSPYHNLTPSVAYPPTLVTTADFDDRVVPGHSFKFASALQYAQAGDAPVLIRIETKAGHGAGKPTTKRIEEAADMWAFLVKSLKMDVD